jgi:hypothetical protein
MLFFACAHVPLKPLTSTDKAKMPETITYWGYIPPGALYPDTYEGQPLWYVYVYLAQPEPLSLWQVRSPAAGLKWYFSHTPQPHDIVEPEFKRHMATFVTFAPSFYLQSCTEKKPQGALPCQHWQTLGTANKGQLYLENIEPGLYRLALYATQMELLQGSFAVTLHGQHTHTTHISTIHNSKFWVSQLCVGSFSRIGINSTLCL